MNIFYVDENPYTAAVMLSDVHIVKMILETAQMLSTAHRLTQKSVPEVLYKTTHKNHPSAVWIRSSRDHYIWAYRHFAQLSMEYTRRYARTHLTWKKLSKHLRSIPKLPKEGFTAPPMCMPDEFKIGKPVDSYRWYYTSKSRSMNRTMTWTNATQPQWFGENYAKMYGQRFYGPFLTDDQSRYGSS